MNLNQYTPDFLMYSFKVGAARPRMLPGRRRRAAPPPRPQQETQRPLGKFPAGGHLTGAAEASGPLHTGRPAPLV